MAGRVQRHKEEEKQLPTLRELMMILFRQGRVLVGVWGVIFVIAVLYAFMGATYRAREFWCAEGELILLSQPNPTHHLTSPGWK